MKSKILLSTLLGGALLSACSTDDAFEINNKVAEKATPAAPVFTVSFEDDELTRAEMGDKGITWEKGDLMSLYHGGGQLIDATGSFEKLAANNDNFYPTGVYAYTRNAIYVSKEGSEGQNEFSTQSMVLPGAAVMIFPADTAMKDRQSVNPIIKLETEQDETTKNRTPFISEVIEITNADDLNEKDNNGDLKNPNTAGYGRNYDVVMRRIGAMLRLSLEATGTKKIDDAGVPSVTFKKVSIETDGAYPFTKELEIEIGQKRGQLDKDGNVTYEPTDPIVGTNTKDHPYWKYTPWIKPRGAKGSNEYKSPSISTTDIRTREELPTAYFTLLLPEDRDETVLKKELEENVPGVTAFKKPAFTKTTITVLTNYGTVTLEDKADAKQEDGFWGKGTPRVHMSMNNGLAEFLTVGFSEYKKTEFEGQYTGQLKANMGTRYLSVDLSNLNMNGLHITNEQDLINVNKVLKVVGVKGLGNAFYLDGDEKGEFTITDPEAYTAYQEIIAYADDKENVELELKLCQLAGEKCNVVVLDNSLLADKNVPGTLKFGKDGTEKVLVQLGNSKEQQGWTLANSHTFVGVDSLVVAPNTTLELVGEVNNLNPDATASDGSDKYVLTTALVNRPKGTINVNGDVTLQMNTRNYGVINVGSEDTKDKVNNVRLRLSSLNVKDVSDTDADKMVTLVNENYASSYAYDDENGLDDLKDKGIINVWTRLSVVATTNGRVYNYGYIELKDVNSAALLYANGTTTTNIGSYFVNNACGKDKIAELHKDDNIFGVLKVNKDAEDPLKLSGITTTQGFVKFDAGKTGTFKKPTKDTKNLVNYIKAGGFYVSGTDLNKTDVAYNEFYKETATKTISSALNLTGLLIVPNGVTISVEKSIGLTVANIHLKGEVYYAGTFTVTNYNSYVKDKNDKNNDALNASWIGK